jgi:hypothetical protein
MVLDEPRRTNIEFASFDKQICTCEGPRRLIQFVRILPFIVLESLSLEIR